MSKQGKSKKSPKCCERFLKKKRPCGDCPLSDKQIRRRRRDAT